MQGVAKCYKQKNEQNRNGKKAPPPTANWGLQMWSSRLGGWKLPIKTIMKKGIRGPGGNRPAIFHPLCSMNLGFGLAWIYKRQMEQWRRLLHMREIIKKSLGVVGL